MQLQQINQQAVERFKLIPNWKKYLYGGIIIASIAYLAWCRWGSQPLQPGAVIISAPKAPQIVKMETTKTPPVRIVVIKDKVSAIYKLGLPPSEAADPKEALLTATAVARNRNGATVTTFVNLSTGQSRTDVTANRSPWFQLEKGNTIGAEGGYSTRGRYAQVDIEHEFMQVKGVFLAGKASATAYETGNADARIGIRLQKHFDWP